MTINRILEDLEENGLEVTRSVMMNVGDVTAHIFDLDSKICLEVQQSLEDGTEFFVSDGCFKNCVNSLYWPEGEKDYILLNDTNAKDYILLNDTNAKDVLDKNSWPKLLKCLRRMLN